MRAHGGGGREAGSVKILHPAAPLKYILKNVPTKDLTRVILPSLYNASTSITPSSDTEALSRLNNEMISPCCVGPRTRQE